MNGFYKFLLSTLIFITLIHVSDQKQQGFCSDFLKCEAQMMTIHKRCTEQARNATGQTCGLNDDFKELNEIMDKRLMEFVECVGSIGSNDLEIWEDFEEDPYPETVCRQLASQNIAEQSTCWRTVAAVRGKCQQLQKCCPSAKSCRKKGQQSAYTQALRAKHIDINRRTLECREQMQKRIDSKMDMNPKVFGAGTTKQKPIDLAGTYKREISDSITPNDHSEPDVKKLAEAIAKVLIKRQQGVYSQSPKESLKVFPRSNRMSKFTSAVSSQKQYGLPSHPRNPLLVFDKNAYHPKGPMQKNNIMKFLKKPYEFERQGIFSSDPMGNGAIPFLIAAKQPQSFAMPGNVNLRKMRVLDARPQYKKVIARQWGRQGNMFGMFPTSTIRTYTNNSYVSLYKSGYTQDGRIAHLNARAHGIRTFAEAQSEAKPIRPLERIPSLNKPVNEAYVNEQGIWTVDHPEFPVTTVLPTTTPLQNEISGYETESDQELQTLTTTTAPIPDPTSELETFAKQPKVIDFDAGEVPPSFKIEPSPRTTTSTAPPHTENVVSGDEDLFQVRTTESSINEATDRHLPNQQFLKKIQIKMPEEVTPVRVDNDANGPELKGYRNKILYGIGQRTTTENTPFVEDFPASKKFMQNPYEETSFDSTSKHHVGMPPFVDMTLMSNEMKEMQMARDELIKNLEEFIRKRERQLHGKVDQDFEADRLEVLRKSRQEYEHDNQKTGYCELYSTCTDQLRYVQKQCEATNGRLMPGLPRRRFGDCHAKLVSEYENLDVIKAKVESTFDNCLIEGIIDGRSAKVSTCPADWPTLPSYESQPKCSQQVQIIQNHCSKLARCCSIVPSCRRHVEGLPIAKEFSLKSQILSRKSAMCQIKAYNDYFQRYKLYAAARQQARSNLAKYQRISGYSSNFPSNQYEDSSKKEFLDSEFRLM